MIVANSQENKKRIVTAPQQSLSLDSTATNIPSIIISVELDENEEVEWIWTTYSDGQQVVTGYKIIKKN